MHIFAINMAEALILKEGTKAEQYESLLPQIRGVIGGESNLIANLANTTAMLREQFNWWWVGFYLVDSQKELVLGPFQGPLACTRIKKGKGVCGGAWQQEKTLIVPDVEDFPGHIACSGASRSEIVVPIIRKGEVVAVLDVDSEHLNHFDETDQQFLEQMVTMIPF